MSDKYQCPDCRFKRMKKLKLLERWWCQWCQKEIDVEQTIKEWREKGFNEKSQNNNNL